MPRPAVRPAGEGQARPRPRPRRLPCRHDRRHRRLRRRCRLPQRGQPRGPRPGRLPPTPRPATSPGASRRGPPPDGATAAEANARRLATPEGRALYKRRAPDVEGLHASLKDDGGLRRFSLRGLHNATSEFLFAGLAHNLCLLASISRTPAIPAWPRSARPGRGTPSNISRIPQQQHNGHLIPTAEHAPGPNPGPAPPTPSRRKKLQQPPGCTQRSIIRLQPLPWQDNSKKRRERQQ